MIQGLDEVDGGGKGVSVRIHRADAHCLYHHAIDMANVRMARNSVWMADVITTAATGK